MTERMTERMTGMIRVFIFCMALAGVLLVCSCTASTDDVASVSPATEEIDTNQLTRATQSARQNLLSGGTIDLGQGVYADFSVVEDGYFDIGQDEAFVYVTIVAATDDVAEACRIGEDALKVLNVMMYPADDVTSGFGTLYETYHASVHVDNPDGTLDVDGLREAGTDTKVLWQ